MNKEELKGKTAIQVNIYLSRVLDKLYVAVDGNLLDLNDFGIDTEKFHSISNKIDHIFQEELGFNIFISPESKF